MQSMQLQEQLQQAYMQLSSRLTLQMRFRTGSDTGPRQQKRSALTGERSLLALTALLHIMPSHALKHPASGCEGLQARMPCR